MRGVFHGRVKLSRESRICGLGSNSNGPGEGVLGLRQPTRYVKGWGFMVSTRVLNAAAWGLVAACAITLGATGMAQAKKPAAPAGQQEAAAEQPQTPSDIWYKLCVDMPVPEPAKPGEQPKPQKPEEMKKVNVCLTQVDLRDPQTAMLVSKIAIRQVAGRISRRSSPCCLWARSFRPALS